MTSATKNSRPGGCCPSASGSSRRQKGVSNRAALLRSQPALVQSKANRISRQVESRPDHGLPIGPVCSISSKLNLQSTSRRQRRRGRNPTGSNIFRELNMRVEPTSLRRMGEQRRYFPDWTHRPLKSRPELEADHNSYLAGGYAEEFGYRAQPGYSRGVPVLDGEPAELCQEWRSEASSTHPGYPLRPKPLAIYYGRAARTSSREPRLTREQSTGEAHHGTFVAVSNRLHQPARQRAPRATAILSTRIAAALIELRWSFRRRNGYRE